MGSVRILSSPLSRMRCALCHQRSTITARTACGLGVCGQCVWGLQSSQGRVCVCCDACLPREVSEPGGARAKEGVILGDHHVLPPPGVGGDSDGKSQTGGSDAVNRTGGGHTGQDANASWSSSAAIGTSMLGSEAGDCSGIDQPGEGGERHPNGRDPSGPMRDSPPPMSLTRCALCHQRGATLACAACGLDICARCVGVLKSSQRRPCVCYDTYLPGSWGGLGGVQATEGAALGSHRVLSPPGVGGGSDGGSQTEGGDGANRMGNDHNHYVQAIRVTLIDGGRARGKTFWMMPDWTVEEVLRKHRPWWISDDLRLGADVQGV